MAESHLSVPNPNTSQPPFLSSSSSGKKTTKDDIHNKGNEKGAQKQITKKIWKETLPLSALLHHPF